MTTPKLQIIRSGRILDIDTMTAPLGDILIADNKIIAIEAPSTSVPEEYVEIDAADKLLIPGLINTHTHGHGALGRGRGDRWSLELLLNAGPWISGKRTLEDKRLSAQLNAAEMVLKGCTSCYDLYFEFPTPTSDGIDEVAKGYADVGTRAVIAPMVADRSIYEAIPGLIDALPEPHKSNAEKIRLAPAATAMQAYRDLLKGWGHDKSQWSLAIAPTIPQHCSDDFLIACRDLAHLANVGIHMHLSESKVQALMGQKIYGKSQTAHLNDLGLLGPDFVGAHCIWMSDDDIEIMARTGAGITHQPGCNMRIGSGIAPVRRFLNAGVPVGVGTDGTNSGDHQNMFDALRLAANVSRLVDVDPDNWVSAQEALTIGTQGSAQLLGRAHDLGQIKPGYLADIVFLDLGNVNYIPFNNPVHQIIHAEDSTAVDTVMINGRIVLKNREFVDFDFAEMRHKVEATIQRLDAATIEEKHLAQLLEPVISSYCMGLQKQPLDMCRTLHGGCG